MFVPLPPLKVITPEGRTVEIAAARVVNILLLVIQEQDRISGLDRGQMVVDWAGHDPVASVTVKGLKLAA